MKITVYELLGMVKDGKAPKKIKYEDEIYELTSNENDYYNKSYGYWFTNQICSLGTLNDEVEILEEEKKIPEKLNYQYRNLYGRLSQHKQSEIDIIDTLNGVIDYLKSKGE